jgi:hypothetical protein
VAEHVVSAGRRGGSGRSFLGHVFQYFDFFSPKQWQKKREKRYPSRLRFVPDPATAKNSSSPARLLRASPFPRRSPGCRAASWPRPRCRCRGAPAPRAAEDRRPTSPRAAAAAAPRSSGKTRRATPAPRARARCVLRLPSCHRREPLVLSPCCCALSTAAHLACIRPAVDELLRPSALLPFLLLLALQEPTTLLGGSFARVSTPNTRCTHSEDGGAQRCLRCRCSSPLQVRLLPRQLRLDEHRRRPRLLHEPGAHVFCDLLLLVLASSWSSSRARRRRRRSSVVWWMETRTI